MVELNPPAVVPLPIAIDPVAPATEETSVLAARPMATEFAWFAAAA
ncbi:hypothetical protein [Burkholderia cenocepacia]|nr:hypothetical protein [Burkholderia cenocepacia]